MQRSRMQTQKLYWLLVTVGQVPTATTPGPEVGGFSLSLGNAQRAHRSPVVTGPQLPIRRGTRPGMGLTTGSLIYTS